VKGMAREVFASRAEAAAAPPPTPGVGEPSSDAPGKPEASTEPTVVNEPEPRAEPERGAAEPAPIRVEDPEPVAVRREAEPRPDGDRSLRELFWGED